MTEERDPVPTILTLLGAALLLLLFVAAAVWVPA